VPVSVALPNVMVVSKTSAGDSAFGASVSVVPVVAAIVPPPTMISLVSIMSARPTSLPPLRFTVPVPSALPLVMATAPADTAVPPV